MKLRFINPYYMLIGASVIIALGFVLIYAFFSHFLITSFNWVLALICSIAIFLLSFFFFRFILKKYIYEKIKVIYKTIHQLKLPLSEKIRTIDLHSDIISKVNQDVMQWAEDYQREIEGLKKMEAFRREFVGNVSHELKTPLFSLQGYILTLIEGALEDPEVNKAYLEKAAKNIERMINIVQDLETISLLESGDISLEYNKFDIIHLIREIFEMLELKANEKNISFIFQQGVDNDTQIMVYADKDRIRQVLLNLLDNSIKYGNSGGRTKISFYDMDENILVEVSDDGIGIEAHHLSRLFERFYRVDKSRSRDLGGSGLGLAIVKHIIESHKQTVNVRSTPGIGSTFSFTIRKG